jgi:hypothetical protein
MRPRREARPAPELDQEWTELVEELRLVIPGVEVLFGFLLVLPFQPSFSELVASQRYVYLGALLSSAVAIVLLISPSVNHRLRWRRGDKDALLRYATWMSIAATLCVAVAMTTSVSLVTGVVAGGSASGMFTATVAALFACFWYGLPLWIRLRRLSRG